MFLLIACLFLFLTTLALIVLRITQPEARYGWLVAVGGALLAFISVLLWLTVIPFDATLPFWLPQNIFLTPISFHADGIAWALSTSITVLVLAIFLTSVTRPVIGNTLSWAGLLTLGGIGVLSVSADNPLTLLLMWAFLDLAEVIALTSSVSGARNNERVVISFATRVIGSAFLLWSYIEGFSNGPVTTFQALPSTASIYLVIAAGLRLGVLPLHLPYDPESSLRRGFGTALRLIGAASTLSVLGHIQIAASGWTTLLSLFVSGAAIYGAWMWLRAPDELNGRPYWLIGMGSLSVISALGGNPTGSAAWACALILTGGALFLFSVQDTRLSRVLLIGVWSLSSLPLSMTATAWIGNTGFILPFVIASQGGLIAGYVRHSLRSSGTESLEDQPSWAKISYPAGIVSLLMIEVLLGFFGWEGALQLGNWGLALIASAMTLVLVWVARRFRIFSPARVHWVSSSGSGVNSLYRGLWAIYRGSARLAQTINKSLEGEGGIMWSLLFLVFFILIITGRPR